MLAIIIAAVVALVLVYIWYDSRSKFIGCYKDKSKPNRAFTHRWKPTGKTANGLMDKEHGVTVDECREYIKENHPDLKHFGMQWFKGDTNPTTGQCWYGAQSAYKYDVYGVSTACNSNNIGDGHTNAVYSI